LKSCKKLAIDEAAALKSYRISLVFLFCNIYKIHQLDIIRKEYVVRLQIVSDATLPNIIKIGQHLTD